MKTITKLRILYPVGSAISMFSLLYASTSVEGSILFKTGQLGQIIMQLFQIAIAVLLYKLFEKTDKMQALFMAILGILAVPLALMAILIPDAMRLAEVFWGLWLIPMGTLVIKSGMFPKWIGYFLYLGASGYLVGTTSFFLTGSIPVYAKILMACELVWVLWITIRGAKEVQT